MKPGRVPVPKSRFQREKEEREARRVQEERAAAAVYEEFAASFAGENRGFVRAGTSGHGHDERWNGPAAHGGPPPPTHPAAAASSSSRSGPAVPDPPKRTLASQNVQGSSTGRRGPSSRSSHHHGQNRAKAAPAAFEAAMQEDMEPVVAKKRPRRQIDAFLEELKSRTAEDMEIEPAGYPPVAPRGSHDDGDPETTNLYVGNLAPSVTEEALKARFAVFGPVDSVKIMWPRTDEERQRRRNCGFVSYVDRSDADDARQALHDSELDGYKITVGWGRAVPRPRHVELQLSGNPYLAAAASTAASLSKNSAASLSKNSAQGFHRETKKPTSNPDAPARQREAPLVSPPPPKVEAEKLDEARIEVKVPIDVDQRDAIELLAEYVAVDGAGFETAVREREAGSPLFAFLRNNTAEATYYRWRVYSACMGSSGVPRPRSQPGFRLQTGGLVWVPPVEADPDNANTGDSVGKNTTTKGPVAAERDDAGGENDDDNCSPRDCSENGADGASKTTGDGPSSRKRGRQALRREDADRWRSLVAQVTVSRAKIAEAMCFAYDHVASAAQIAGLLVEALQGAEAATSLATRAARLFLTSDILRNSSQEIRGAQQYRTLLQPELPAAVLALNRAHRATSSRMAAKTLEDRVARVLATWLRWSIFPPLFVHGLEATFFYAGDKTLQQEAGLSSSAENSDDVDVLRRRARQAGLPDTLEKDDLVARLAHARAYVKYRTLGREPRRAAEAALSDLSSGRDRAGLGRSENKQQDDDAPAVLPSSTTPAPARPATDKATIKPPAGAWIQAENLDGEPFDAEALAFVDAVNPSQGLASASQGLAKPEAPPPPPPVAPVQEPDKKPAVEAPPPVVVADQKKEEHKLSDDDVKPRPHDDAGRLDEHQREQPREHQREPPREHPREPPREHQRELPREHPREPPREHQREPPREHQREPPREHQREPPREHQREPQMQPATTTSRDESSPAISTAPARTEPPTYKRDRGRSEDDRRWVGPPPRTREPPRRRPPDDDLDDRRDYKRGRRSSSSSSRSYSPSPPRRDRGRRVPDRELDRKLGGGGARPSYKYRSRSRSWERPPPRGPPPPRRRFD